MSLRARFLLLLNSLLVVAVLVLGSAAMWRWHREAETALIHQAHSTGKSAAQMAALPIQVADREELRRLADGLLLDEDIRYCLFEDGTGRILATYGDISTVPTRSPAPQPNGGNRYDVLRSNGILDICSPVLDVQLGSDEGAVLDSEGVTRLVGRVRLGVSISRLRATTTSMVLWMVLVVAAILTTGTLAALWGTSRFLRPVSSLIEATREVAGGRFDMRVQGVGGSELGALASSFNTMVDSLDKLMKELSEQSAALEKANEESRRTNRELEARVKERTAELAKANQRLEREIADKNDFLRTVSHDLGAPLRNILGMADSITRRHGDGLPDQVKDRLARVRTNAQAEIGLIGELLELSRIRTRQPELVEANIGEIVRNVTDSLAGDIEEKSIDLRVADDLPTIWCEKARIGQAFQNLIDNAAKYMPDRADGRIEVGWHEDDGCYVFHVKDNGDGILPEDKEKIFYVFRRSKTAASQAEGKGVGLAAVKAIAETYDGEAWVESEMGKGSTFYFSLAKERVSRPAVLLTV